MCVAEALAIIPGLESLSDLWQPLQRLPWTSWSAFWYSDTLYGRNLVLLFLPLIPVLWGLGRRSARHLRCGLVASGLLFVGYAFGAAYLAFWVASCLFFYRISERFAVEVRRTDVWRGGPPLAAITILTAYFLLVHGLDDIRLPEAVNTWLARRTPWLLPFGYRGWAWEPDWRGGQTQFFRLLLHRSHDIGTAYLVMRLVPYFSEIKRGTLPDPQRGLLKFMAFVCYAPTLIQGPLERYREFDEQVETCRQRWSVRDLLAGGGRLVLAAFKVALFQAYLAPWAQRVGLADPELGRHPEQAASYAVLFFAMHFTVFGLYLLFSAYCDLSIGMSRLLGLRIVENFRYFWMARSLTDMWRRWHISLSFILRDYIYFPLIRRRWNGTLVLVITFFVCGVWHSLHTGYVLWGILMGLLVAVNQKWVRWMRSLDRRPESLPAKVRRGWLRLRPLPTLAAWLLTINVFVLTGWVCFFGVQGFRVYWELLARPVRALLGSG